MTKTKKVILGSVVILAVLVVALIVIVPLLVDVDRYRPEVAAHIQKVTGKAAEIGHLSLSVFPGVSIRVDNFGLHNPAGFPPGYFIKVRRIDAQVDAGALWDRQVLIKSLELDGPSVNLLSDARGKWNFENSPGATPQRSEASHSPSSFSLGVISKVTLHAGDLTAANLLASGRPGPTFFEAHGVSSELEQVDLNAFTSSSSASLFRTLPSSPGLFGAGWGTLLAYAATSQAQPAAQGTLKADSLKFGSLQATSVKTRVRLFPKRVTFDDLRMDLYGGHATGVLSFDFARQDRYVATAKLAGVDVAKLLEAFPGARGKMTGTLDGNMKLAGEVTHSPDPLAGMRGVGQVSVRNGQLPSLQLNKNLMTLARLASLGSASGDPSSFSSMAADLNIANDRINSNKVTIVGNGVNVDGSGNLSLAGAGNLDYQGIAKLAAGQNSVTNVLAGLSGATMADGKLSFPFNIAGTLQNPIFRLKSGGGAGGLGALQGLAGSRTGQPGGTQQTQQQNPADVVQGITGLFKKKKPPQ